MNAPSTIRLVAGRELRERGRSKAYAIGTTILVLGVAAAIVLPAKLGHHGRRTFQVGTVGAIPVGLASSVASDAAALGGRVRIRAFSSLASAISAVRGQTLDVLIEGESAVLVRGEKTDQSASDLAHLLARDLAVKQRLRAAGLPAGQIPTLLSTPPPPVRSLVPMSQDDAAKKAIVVLGTILLYLSLATYGSWVTSGVLEEKSSRVVEVILSAVRPRELLAGKVIGIGLLGLGQFAAVALTGTIAAITVG